MNYYKHQLAILGKNFDELMDMNDQNDQDGWGRTGLMGSIEHGLDQISDMLKFMTANSHRFTSAEEAYKDWEADQIAIDA